MKEGRILQLMCISPQWNIPVKTFNHFLYALLVILCTILPSNTVGTFQTRRCELGLFLHVNPETRTRVCCITVPLPKGYEYISCEENGTHDRIEKCPEGLYQVDNTTTASEAKCTSEIECSPEENLKISDCDAHGHCIFTCVCNYDKGYCGPNFYDCQSFPSDCPRKWVQKDCTCKWKPTAATSLALGNATNKSGQKIITTPSTILVDGESNPTEDRTAIGEDDDDKVLLTMNNNGTGLVPDQKQRSLQQYEIIIIVISAVGIPACIAGLAVYCWKSKRNREYQSVDYSDGPSDSNNSNGSGGGSSSDTDNRPDSAMITQTTEKVIDHSNGPNDNNSNHDGGGSSSDIDNRPDNAMITQPAEEVIGYSQTGADNGAGCDGFNGSRKRSVAIVRPQPKGIAQDHLISGLSTASGDDRCIHSQVHYTSGPSAADEGHMHQISSSEHCAMRGMSVEGYSHLTWSVLDNPTDPPDEETAVLKIDNQQEQDDVTSEQQSSDGAHTEETQQVATNNMEDDVATDESH